jgi:O-acetyl-ADP-ribose deacetylase (regulator of RNase III)
MWIFLPHGAHNRKSDECLEIILKPHYDSHVMVQPKRIHITLADINVELVRNWENEFAGFSDVIIFCGNIFTLQADAIVSPANSFGIMDGGLDGKLRDFFGLEMEKKVRARILADFPGELPVGMAIISETGNKNFPFLITAPTMRVPQNVEDSINAYLAMKAILYSIQKEPRITSIVVPGLCSLTGKMIPGIIARQMRVAYEKMLFGKFDYTHWREEKAFEKYLQCKTDFSPDDLESRESF